MNRARAKARARRLEVLKARLFFIMTFVMIIIFLSAFSSLKVDAHGRAGANEVKRYESHFIEPGDTLWSLADEHVDGTHYKSASSYIKEVRQVNGFKGDKLEAGNYILLPYFEDMDA